MFVALPLGVEDETARLAWHCGLPVSVIVHMLPAGVPRYAPLAASVTVVWPMIRVIHMLGTSLAAAELFVASWAFRHDGRGVGVAVATVQRGRRRRPQRNAEARN